VKADSNVGVDLYINNERLEASEDKKLISQVPLRDKMVGCGFWIVLNHILFDENNYNT